MMKRDDLQAIRGIAILLVLVFHLRPLLFPLGFVGVDMFFVLSGFLMTMILSKDSLSMGLLWSFYTRRFKRIVPLMYVVLAGVYVGCSFLLFGVDKDQLKTDLTWSLPFLSNIQPLYEVLGYWDQVISYRFLVHCWSLGVEIQFYVIAPFIIHGSNLLSPWKRRAALLLLAAGSLLFQLLSPPKVAYGLLPSRIWQFLLGTLCYDPEYQEYQPLPVEKECLVEDGESGKEEPEAEHPKAVPRANRFSEVSMLLLSGVVLLNLSAIFTQDIMRILGTVATAYLIRHPQPVESSWLTNRLLVYIGDISYVTYLVHWPIIVAAKYILDTQDLWTGTVFWLFLLIIVVSVLVHHTLENFLLKSTLLFGFLVAVCCLLLICITFPFYDSCCHIRKPLEISNQDIAAAIKWNEAENKKVYFKLPCDPDTVTPKWTNFTDEDQLRCQAYGNGTATIVVMGNSMAYRAYPLIHKILNGRYRELRLYSRSARPPLTEIAPHFTAAAHIVVDKIRPDILWNIHVQGDYLTASFDEGNKKKDKAYVEMESNLNFYKSRTKVFLIDLPFYWSPEIVAYEMVKRLRAGKSLQDLKVPQREMAEQQLTHRQRIRAIPCDRCVYLDVESRMVDHGYYWLYNRKNYHAYSKDGKHFTWDMLDRIEPLYRKAIDEAMQTLAQA